MGFTRVFSILLILITLLCIAGPVSAGERYLSGGPNLTAAIIGPNDFSPGEEVNLPVAIQNSGLLQDDLPIRTRLRRQIFPTVPSS